MAAYKQMIQQVLLMSACLLTSLTAYADEPIENTHQSTPFDHAQWNTLLSNNVINLNEGKVTQVDYAQFKIQSVELDKYLAQLSSVSSKAFGQWNKADQLAFLINAYNAFTVKLILSRYPDISSIKDIGFFFSPPWKKSFISLMGDTVSLDYIEHDLIRGSKRYNDPRIHFALNCASIGCPALASTAYQGNMLDIQLDTATRLFLSDQQRNRLDGDELNVSSIFKWYRDDFSAGWKGTQQLADFFILFSESLNLDQKAQVALKNGSIKIEFLDYDWRLNDKRPSQ